MSISKEIEIIQRALKCNPFTDVSSSNGDTILKEIYIDNKNFSNSTLAIWQNKGDFFPSTKQYVKYKKVTLEFQLGFSCFTNPYADFYQYTFTRCI